MNCLCLLFLKWFAHDHSSRLRSFLALELVKYLDGLCSPKDVFVEAPPLQKDQYLSKSKIDCAKSGAKLFSIPSKLHDLDPYSSGKLNSCRPAE